MASKAVKSINCCGCGRTLLNLKGSIGDYDTLGDQDAADISEALFEQVKVVLPCTYDVTLCATCYNDPETREFFECCACKKSMPVKQLAFLASDEECCNDSDFTVRVCDTCVSSMTAWQLIAKLQAVRLINATNNPDPGDLYGLFMGAKKIPVPKKSKAK